MLAPLVFALFVVSLRADSAYLAGQLQVLRVKQVNKSACRVCGSRRRVRGWEVVDVENELLRSVVRKIRGQGHFSKSWQAKLVQD